jgi:hypothetical protein
MGGRSRKEAWREPPFPKGWEAGGNPSPHRELRKRAGGIPRRQGGQKEMEGDILGGLLCEYRTYSVTSSRTASLDQRIKGKNCPPAVGVGASGTAGCPGRIPGKLPRVDY